MELASGATAAAVMFLLVGSAASPDADAPRPAPARSQPDLKAPAPKAAASDPRIIAVPGVMELSGRLVARPVQPAAGLRAADLEARAGRARAALAPVAIAHFPEVDEFVIPLPAGETEAQAIGRMMATGDYQYVTPDWICYPVDEPNDPRFPDQWHHATMQSPAAWEITQGSNQIVCAFVDTGVDVTHPDLAPRLVLGYNSVSDTPQDFGGEVFDVNGHGTAVAGSAAAIGNNAVGVAGIGWNMWIMPIRTSNAAGGGAFMSDILEGARWAADNGADVVSASYTGVSDPSVGTTGTYIRSVGRIFCFAAGNSASNLQFEHADVIVVGATAPDDSRAGFSSFGTAVDVAAPGVDVWTTTNGGGYGPASGTSFATPVVNGVLGMIWSVNPAMTPAQVESILFTSCDDLGTPGEDETFGNGRVNLFRAVRDAAATLGPAAPYAVADRLRAIMGTPRLIDVLANDFDVNGDSLELAAFPAASAMGGTLTRSVGTGPGGRDQLLFTPGPSVGDDSFGYTIRDATGLEDTAVVHIDVLDGSSFRAADAAGATRPGVLARYFELASLDALPDFSVLTPHATELRADINIPSTDGAFAGSGRADQVGAVMTGYVRVPVADLYTFSTSSDDGSALFIGETLVVDNDGLHGMQERSGAIGLLPGLHAVRVEFFENGGGAGLVVSIAGGGLSKQVLPASMYRDASCPGDWDLSGGVNSSDISAFLTNWLADVGAPNGAADVNGDGAVNSSDISAFLTAWLAGVTGC